MSIITTRREFIRNGLAFLSIGIGMPTFLMRAAKAAADAPAQFRPADKILVVIEMQGGNDGLNTVIPYTDPNYAKFRPTIGIAPGDVIQVGDGIGLHPNLAAFKPIFEKGNLAVVTGVGYPNPNRSHFHSMDIWQTGNLDVDVADRTGWIARYFDADGHLKSNPISGITVGSALPLALYAETSPVAVISGGADFGFTSTAPDKQAQTDTLKALYAEGTIAATPADFVRNVGADAYTSTEELKKALRDYDVKAGSAAAYPQANGLATGLQTVSKLITGGVPTRVYYLTIGGFDTHANQPRQHANLMTQLAEAINAFYQDLAMQGCADDVTVMTFSEFGRRVKENGSQGTDHGAASVLFVAGGSVKGGVKGAYPSLSDLEDGDLRFHTDFRSVYATILDKWIGGNSQNVLGDTFPHVDLV